MLPLVWIPVTFACILAHEARTLSEGGHQRHGLDSIKFFQGAEDLLVAPLLQKKLRERESSREQSSDSSVRETYPLQPIGHLQSCFTKRSGTPRQPLLVPAARARLVLRC